MRFTIPLPLQHEHEALHERLSLATQAGGEVGEAARKLAQLMHPHFVKEDQFALPPLGLLVALARGEWSGEIRFTRLDNGQSVELSHRPQVVPRPAALSELLRDASVPQASAAARRAFADAWQGWVRTIVIEHADDPAMIAMASRARA